MDIVIGRLISTTVIRSCIKRNIPLIYAQTAGYSDNRNSSYNRSEYYSDDNDDGDFNRGRQSNYGARENNYRARQGYDEDYQPRERYDDYKSRGGFIANSRYDRGFDRNRSFGGDNLTQINWEQEALTPLVKNGYCQSETVGERSEEEVNKFRKHSHMRVNGRDIPNPIQEFTDYDFSEDMQNMMRMKGFERPTAIQAQGWPIALSGRDLVGIGQTGSGKTLGYVLPAISHIRNRDFTSSRGQAQPIALVMAPTRELAQQIEGVAREIKYSSSNIRTACLYGGASKGGQLSMLNRSPSICIATPGRLLDFLEMGAINLKQCSFLVLDEADRMLDMGFEPQIKKVVSQIRPDRQTLMWSATWPKEIQSLAYEFLDNYIQIKIGSTDLTANSDITQKVKICEPFDKDQFFNEIIKEELDREPKAKILVFTDTKRQVDYIESSLRRLGVRSAGIHGDHSQRRREDSLASFREGRNKVLIATDVASRGLDVNDISLVVNYDCPNNIESYVHRIGRTGRAGKSGTSITLLTSQDGGVLKDLVKVLKESKQEVTDDLITLSEMADGYKSGKRGRSGSYDSYNRYDNRRGGNNYRSRSSGYSGGRNNRYSNNRNDRYSDYQ